LTQQRSAPFLRPREHQTVAANGNTVLPAATARREHAARLKPLKKEESPVTVARLFVWAYLVT
jgi:hypothetical protein